MRMFGILFIDRERMSVPTLFLCKVTLKTIKKIFIAIAGTLSRSALQWAKSF